MITEMCPSDKCSLCCLSVPIFVVPLHAVYLGECARSAVYHNCLAEIPSLGQGSREQHSVSVSWWNASVSQSSLEHDLMVLFHLTYILPLYGAVAHLGPCRSILPYRCHRKGGERQLEVGKNTSPGTSSHLL